MPASSRLRSALSPDVRDIACDFLWPQLCITGGDFRILRCGIEVKHVRHAILRSEIRMDLRICSVPKALNATITFLQSASFTHVRRDGPSAIPDPFEPFSPNFTSGRCLMQVFLVRTLEFALR